MPPNARPPMGGAPFPPQARGPAPQPGAANRPTPAPGTPVVGAPPPAGMNPFANMRAPQGGFDLRSIDDGAPVQNVRSGRGKAVLIASVVVGIGGFALGAGMGIASVGRANMNTANHAAKAVKTELDNMQKTLSQIGTAVARSQQRLAAAKKEPVAYDPQFVADLKAIKLEPRPNTATIFRVDFYRLPDADVDKLFNYYYDTIALYNEVERHVRRSENDADALKSYAEKSAGSTTKNYGVVFDNGGKILVANLVEVGDQVCKNGGKDCGADNLVGFKIRSGSGAPWVDRKTGSKPDASILVPLKPTPFMDAVMTGSPDQARQESYKQRVANIRTLLAQITATGKDVMEGISKDAARPDMFAPL